jgi:CRISPR-associated protein Cas2
MGMNKFMRIIVFFDLPVDSASNRREAARFRKFLLNDGYHMLQYSVYARVCNGMDAVEKHKARIRLNLPENGAIRMLTITEKQYESIEILLGPLSEADQSFQAEQLSFF